MKKEKKSRSIRRDNFNRRQTMMRCVKTVLTFNDAIDTAECEVAECAEPSSRPR